MTRRAPQPTVPDDEREFREHIEQTREQLGQTVQQLAAKMDVKGMARAKAAELTGQVKGRTVAIAKERRAPLAVAAAVLLAGCAGLLWWKSR